MDDITFHKVSAGENLYNISVKYNTKISTLRKWNNISEKNTIRINQKLYVVDPDTVKNINE
jgi:LysM repeat protein